MTIAALDCGIGLEEVASCLLLQVIKLILVFLNFFIFRWGLLWLRTGSVHIGGAVLKALNGTAWDKQVRVSLLFQQHRRYVKLFFGQCVSSCDPGCGRCGTVCR